MRPILQQHHDPVDGRACAEIGPARTRTGRTQDDRQATCPSFIIRAML